ncbi:MAG: threonine aldolase, partial [Firmicutes bacterium]|nr:threonine aldolase [Bacillota bacterium]
GAHANRMAEIMAQAFVNHGYSFYAPVCTNQLFPILSREVIEQLEKEYGFQLQERIDEKYSAVRFVTSWATTKENIDRFVDFLKNM